MSLRCLGVGAVTRHGLLAGTALRAAVASPLPPGAGARVPEFDEDAIGGAKGWRRMAPVSRFALAACALAARDAGLDAAALAGPDTALVLGTRFGSLTLFEAFHRALADEGPRAVSPTVFTTGVLNAPTGHASLERRWQGPTHTLVGGAAAGIEALGVAAELLAAGVARRVFAAGAEEWAPLLEVGRAAAGARRRGLPVGEGAVALLLEAGGARGAELLVTRLGRPGARHGAAAAHAALVVEARAGAGTVTECWRAGGEGAADRREAAACAGLPAPRAVAPALGYAPAVTSLAAAACAALAPPGAVALATAAGGIGASGVVVWRGATSAPARS